jgi:hypothetical protein
MRSPLLRFFHDSSFFERERDGRFPKRLALRRLVTLYKPDVIVLQETTVFGAKETGFLSSLLPNWSFSSLDAVGMFDGLITT